MQTLETPIVTIEQAVAVPEGIDAPRAYALCSVGAGCHPPVEGTSFRVVADSEYLTIYAQLEDRDIIATGTGDGLPHYELGDVLEVFVATPDLKTYWELYATPKGYKTCLFFPQYRQPADDPAMREALLVESAEGPGGWTTVMKIPVSALLARVSEQSLDGWRILVARYNYTGGLSAYELSAYPQLPEANFHLLEHYAVLRME